MLVVLETLSPAERAAFVLHDVFGLPFDQVARALGRAPAACRKLASRARRHIQERQPRFEVDAESHREVVAAFCAAAQSGDIEALLQVLDPDAVMTTDGGGVVRALPAPLRGAREIAEFLANGARLAPGRQFQVTAVNGQPALLMGQAGRLFTVIALGIRNGRIATIDAVVNPHKFHGLQHTAQPGDSRGNTPWKPDSTS
jgi:RNA polymerase sigma-70 factor (ECF subfamily)